MLQCMMMQCMMHFIVLKWKRKRSNDIRFIKILTLREEHWK